MSVAVTSWVWQHADAGGHELLVLLAIADAADDDGTNAWPSMDTLTAKTRLSESTVRRCIARLAERKALKVYQRGGPSRHASRHPGYRSNRYTVPMPGPAQPAKPDPWPVPDEPDTARVVDRAQTRPEPDTADPPRRRPSQPDGRQAATAQPDQPRHTHGQDDRPTTPANPCDSGGQRRPAQPDGTHADTQPVLKGSSLREEPSAPTTDASTAVVTPTEVLDPVAPPARGRPPGRPNRLLAGQVVAEHWHNATPKPVLRGGFVALKGLTESFLDAGHTPAQVRWALRHTRAYTADAITFTIRQATLAPVRLSRGDAAVIQARQVAGHVAALQRAGTGQPARPIAVAGPTRRPGPGRRHPEGMIMTTSTEYRVHVAGTRGDTDHALRFHRAGAALAGTNLHTGVAAGRPWVSATISAAGPLDAVTKAAAHMHPAAGPLTELFAWPADDEQPNPDWDTPLPDLAEPPRRRGDTAPDAGAGAGTGEHGAEVDA